MVTLICSSGLGPGSRCIQACTSSPGEPSPPLDPLPPFPPFVPEPPGPGLPAIPVVGSMAPGVPSEPDMPSKPSIPSDPFVPLDPEKSATNARSYRAGTSICVTTAGCAVGLIRTCPTLPSLTRQPDPQTQALCQGRAAGVGEDTSGQHGNADPLTRGFSQHGRASLRGCATGYALLSRAAELKCQSYSKGQEHPSRQTIAGLHHSRFSQKP